VYATTTAFFLLREGNERSDDAEKIGPVGLFKEIKWKGCQDCLPTDTVGKDDTADFDFRLMDQ
jgi:hypothetical protein